MSSPRPRSGRRPLVASPPVVDGIIAFDDVAARLGEWRRGAGNPSYSAIVRTIRALRAARGLPPGEHAPGRITVYDCFKRGRRRLDIDLVVDIGRALGLDDAQANEWERACWAVQHQVAAARVVTARASLPELVAHFVGRAGELDLLTRPGEHRRVFLLAGMPGSGKTQLAVRAAHALLQHGEVERVVFADLRGFDPDRPPADPDAMFDAIARTLGHDPRRLPVASERRAALGRLLADRRALLVLDDAASPEQIHPLVPEEAEVPVLITSRVALFDHLRAVPVPLGMLTDGEAVMLLMDARQASAGPSTGTGTDAERDAARRLATSVGHLPLALGIVTARIAARPTWTLADHHDALAKRHEQLRMDDAVRAAVDLSYDALPVRTQRALRLLAVQPCPTLGRDSLAALVGADAEAAEVIAGELLGVHMAVTTIADRIGLHALVRAYASAVSYDEDRPVDRDQAIADLCDHLVATAWAAAAAIYPDSPVDQRYPTRPCGVTFDADRAVRWLEVERENLLTVSDPELRGIRSTVAIELSEALAHHFDRSGLHHDALIVHDRALAAAREVNDQCGEGRAELHLGQNLVRLSEFERGAEHLHRAQRLLSELEDHQTSMSATNALAIIDTLIGNMESALRRFQDVLEAARALGATGPETAVLDNIAIVLRRMGDLDGAVRHHQQAHALAVDHGYEEQAATTLTNLSDVHMLQGRPAVALEVAGEALRLARRGHFLPLAACASSNIGLAMAALGRAREGFGYHQRALTCAREIGRRHLELSILNDLGYNSISTDDLDGASGWFDEAGRLAQQLDDDFEQARCRDGQARIAQHRGAISDARRQWAAALALFETLGAPEAAAVRASLDALTTTTTGPLARG